MNDIETIFIDGSIGEGGGQILRTSLALSCITGKRLHIENIRSARRNPGLAKQHLSCVQAACQICNGKSRGAAQGSKVLNFQAGPVGSGDFRFDIGSAGSASLNSDNVWGRMVEPRFRLHRVAFTLIELLVVISVIAVLMAILMPALMRAKEAGKTVKCQANLRTLTTAWYTYAVDNDDKLCGSWNYNGSNWGKPYDWAWAPWQVNGNSAVSDYFNATREERHEGIKRGVLYPYTKSVACYHCPSDQSLGENFRSYSMPDSLNGWWSTDRPGGFANWSNVLHLSQIANPAQAYVLLEENDPRGYNINAWVIDPSGATQATNWSDPLVVWHGARSSFGFADGHAETWKWSIETLKLFRDFTQWRQPTPQTYEGIEDLKRIHRGWPVPNKAGKR